ncbi:hypothetical protein CVT26_000601 [Gymnopilus dilepis]|uniref:Gti1/Pac2 family protein n=1 Tax=Gymnopilus dilepis TaxID=231916 RepID=A0A409Y291_9AGAR|nr:hypothetical protein CVT26_000601 [Gymnopilus dilepis]
MSADQEASLQQQPSSSSTPPGQGQAPQPQAAQWPEPPWSGWIETTGDALLILEAAKRGIIPRVTRRLVDSERRMITSGSVFVFDEDESGIKRWTDGYFWSPSRILGNFLLYRETDKRGAGHRAGGGGARADARGDSDPDDAPAPGDGQTSLARPKDHSGIGIDKQRERKLMGSLTNSYKFKENGLMKKTFSVTINGRPQTTQHLISYYRIEDVQSGRLRSPSSLPELASLDISPEYLDKTHFRIPPKVEVGVDGLPRYRGEADESEVQGNAILVGPLTSAGHPLLTPGRIETRPPRAKRHDPLASPPKKRRNTRTSEPDGSPAAAEPVSPAISTHSSTPQPAPPPPPPPAPYPPYGVPAAYYHGFPPPPPPGVPGHPLPYGPPPAVPPYAAPLPPPGPGGGTPQGQVVAPPGVSPSNSGNGSSGAGSPSVGQQQQAPQYGAYAGYPPPPPASAPTPAPIVPPSASPPAQPATSAQPPASNQQVHRINPSQSGPAAPSTLTHVQVQTQQQPQSYYPYYPPPPPHVPPAPPQMGYGWPGVPVPGVYPGYPPPPQAPHPAHGVPHGHVPPPMPPPMHHGYGQPQPHAYPQHPQQPKQEGSGNGAGVRSGG